MKQAENLIQSDFFFCQRFCALNGKVGKPDTMGLFVSNSEQTSYYSRRSRIFRGG